MARITSHARRPWHAFIGPRTRSVALVAGVAVVLWAKPMGLLLWARLRLLANIPRTAIADDEALLAGRFEPSPLPSAGDPEVVVLPRAASRNPFAESGSPHGIVPREPDSPRNSTFRPVADLSDRNGEEKSNGKSAE
jgi:hypothetical protein